MSAGERYTDDLPSDRLDPELQGAVDGFFDAWRERVVKRLVVGEARYKSQWKEMMPREIMDSMIEEALDFVAYSIFLRHQERDAD